MVYFKARETQTSWRLSIQTPHSRTLLLWGNNASYFTSCELPILGGEQILNSHDIFSRDTSLYSLRSMNDSIKWLVWTNMIKTSVDKDHGHTCYRAEQASQILSSARVDASAADLDLMFYFKLSYLIWCRFLSLRRTSCLWFDENPA